MCGRYAIYDIDGIGVRYDVELPENLKPNYNVAPTHRMPVIVQKDKSHELEIMRWGIPRTIGKDLIKELINTRSDRAFGRFWKKNVTERRCLIPANGFFEWKKNSNGKTPYFIKPDNQDLFSFAGIWSNWEQEGTVVNTFSIMTTEASVFMNGIHDRMPVMLLPHEEEAWLNTPAEDVEAISSLLHPYGTELRIKEATKEVNNVKNNYTSLIEGL